MALITPLNTESRHKWFQICHRSSSAISGFLVISLRFSYPHDHKIVAMASLSHDNSNIGRKDELLPHFWSSPQTSWTISLVLSYMTTISPITGKRCLAPIIGSASGFDLEVGPISAELMAAYIWRVILARRLGVWLLARKPAFSPQWSALRTPEIKAHGDSVYCKNPLSQVCNMGTLALSLPGYTEVLGEVPRVSG